MHTAMLTACTAYRVVWTDRAGIRHATAPAFACEESALRFARLLSRDPAVTEAYVRPVVLNPIPVALGGPAHATR